MRDYAKVSPTFWTGETGKSLRRRGLEAVLVGVYLMTSPTSNMLGLYYQPVLYMAHETGLGIEGASKGLHECIEAGLCQYDERTEIVWVMEMASYQIAPVLKVSDLRCKGIQKDYDALPKNPFLGAFFDRYALAFHMSDRRSSEGPSDPPKKPLPSKEQEQEQEKEHVRDHQAALDPARPSAEPADLDLVGDPPKPKGVPDCPHLEILSLWAEVMPDFPQHLADEWGGTRADHLRARWRKAAAMKQWTDKAQGLAYFRKLFGWIQQSPFLSGRVPPMPGKRQFALELEWLVNPTNWAKVIEGKYHEEATA